MGQPAGNPHGTVRRHDPDSVFNLAVDDTTDREKQLRFPMVVPQRLLQGLKIGDSVGRDERARKLIDMRKPIAMEVYIHRKPRRFPIWPD
jgi:hypothetical protein